MASASVSTCQEESCMDETGDKTTRCINLLPPHHELHDAPTAQVSRMIKCMLKAVCDLRQINHRRCTLSGMYRDGLNPPKLPKHPLWKISYLTVSVSQPSRAKADPLKQTCLTVLSIWGHDNARQIQRIQIVSIVVWCTQTKQWLLAYNF